MTSFTRLGIGLLWVVPACAPATPDNSADVAALRQADSAYSASVKALDAAGVASHYAADAVTYPPNEATVTGSGAFQEYATGFMSVPGMSVSTTGDAVVVVSQSGDLGYTVNLLDVAIKDSSANTTNERFRDLHIWRKDAAGNWKIVYDIWNSERPLVTPPQH